MYHSDGILMMEPGHTADKIRTAREQRGWSLVQLGQRAGVDPSTIWKIESGATQNPGNITLGKISAALGVAISEITGERPMPRRKADVVEGVAYVPVVRLRGVQQPDPLTWEDTRETVVVKATIIAGRPNVRALNITDNAMSPWVIAGERVVVDPE